MLYKPRYTKELVEVAAREHSVVAHSCWLIAASKIAIDRELAFFSQINHDGLASMSFARRAQWPLV